MGSHANPRTARSGLWAVGWTAASDSNEHAWCFYQRLHFGLSIFDRNGRSMMRCAAYRYWCCMLRAGITKVSTRTVSYETPTTSNVVCALPLAQFLLVYAPRQQLCAQPGAFRELRFGCPPAPRPLFSSEPFPVCKQHMCAKFCEVR